MKEDEAASRAGVLQNLPSVDELLRTDAAAELARECGDAFAARSARKAVDTLRKTLLSSDHDGASDRYALLERSAAILSADLETDRAARQRRVINATGVVLHTNLGRAVLSARAREAMVEAAGYSTVEYDVANGKRGPRGSRVEALISELTGAEAAMIVNNCAAAAFLALTVFAMGGEVLISRGELVEIGGDFRVPDVLERSGAILREVGTTNRTRTSDYEKAFNDRTRMILKVHPSNYRIVGFTSSPDLEELAALAKERGVVLIEDAGSGALIDLEPFGLDNEPVISESIKAGVDLVTFSGDKLLGACQAGIIAGRADLIAQLRSHPLYRVLRVDKISYAVLGATLEAYRRGSAIEEVPVLQMISATASEIAERAASFVGRLSGEISAQIVDGRSAIGGGAAPDLQPQTSLIVCTHPDLSTERLEYALRHASTPVIARIAEGRLLLDLRTVAVAEEEELLAILGEI